MPSPEDLTSLEAATRLKGITGWGSERTAEQIAAHRRQIREALEATEEVSVFASHPAIIEYERQREEARAAMTEFQRYMHDTLMAHMTEILRCPKCTGSMIFDPVKGDQFLWCPLCGTDKPYPKPGE